MLAKIPWFVLALIHLLPASALFRPGALTSLYGLPNGSPLTLLIQHRAALFLCVVIAAIWGAFDEGARGLACTIIGVSMICFLVLYWTQGAPQNLRTIAIADLVGLPFLVWAAMTAFKA